MNIYEKMNTKKLSSSERSIRDFIVHDPHQFVDLQIDAIARKCNVSRASIYRFCDKLDLNGIAELKVRLIADLDNYKKENHTFDFDYPVKSGVSADEIVFNIREDYEKTILATYNVFDSKVLSRCALEMKRAEMIDVYASAGNIYFADNFRFQMAEIGKEVKVPHEQYLHSLTASSSNDKHFAIVISFGGRGILVKEVIKKLIQNHTRFLLISSEEAEQINPFANFRLVIPNIENHSDKISSFSTRMSLLYILDSLYTTYFELDYEENQKKKKEFYQIMTEE